MWAILSKSCSILHFDTLPVGVWTHLHLAALDFLLSQKGRGCKSICSNPFKGLKGLSGLYKTMFPRTEWTTMRQISFEMKRNPGFVTCYTFGKPKLKYLSWQTHIRTVFQVSRSLVSYTELSVNVEEAKEITTYVWQNLPALQRFFPKSLDPPKCFPLAGSYLLHQSFHTPPASKYSPSIFPKTASHL